jgi:integrase
MTAPTNFITARTIDRLAKVQGRHPVKDAKGLKLTVKPTGLAYWTYRYRFDGRETELSLGAYIGADPAEELKNAIAAHGEKRALVLKKTDPQGDRHAKRRAPVRAQTDTPTFGEAAEEHLKRRELNLDLRNAKHARQWRSTLEGLPDWFRNMKVTAIEPEHVYKAIEPTWTATPETGARLRTRIEAVLDSARDSKDTHPNPAVLAGWLKTQLGRKRVNKDPILGGRVHHLALPYRRIPELMAKLQTSPNITARVLQYIILTAARSGEALNATWDEIKREYEIDAVVDNKPTNWIAPMWEIPAAKMKMYRRHRVPLSSAALAILKHQENERGANPHIFPGARSMKPLSNTAIEDELKRLGFAKDTTIHGLRASFRSWAKSIGVPPELGEEALAHASGDNTVKAYDRDDVLARRIALMERWAEYCLGLKLLPKPEAVQAPSRSPRTAATRAERLEASP